MQKSWQKQCTPAYGSGGKRSPAGFVGYSSPRQRLREFRWPVCRIWGGPGHRSPRPAERKFRTQIQLRPLESSFPDQAGQANLGYFSLWKIFVDTFWRGANTDRASKCEAAEPLCARQCTEFVGVAHTHGVLRSLSNLSLTFLLAGFEGSGTWLENLGHSELTPS